MEGKASVHQAYPVSRTTGEARAEIFLGVGARGGGSRGGENTAKGAQARDMDEGLWFGLVLASGHGKKQCTTLESWHSGPPLAQSVPPACLARKSVISSAICWLVKTCATKVVLGGASAELLLLCFESSENTKEYVLTTYIIVRFCPRIPTRQPISPGTLSIPTLGRYVYIFGLVSQCEQWVVAPSLQQAAGADEQDEHCRI